MHLGVFFIEVYIAPKFGTIVVGILHRQFFDACALQQGNAKPSLLVSDNVFRVGVSVRTFVELQNALHLFEQQTQVSFT